MPAIEILLATWNGASYLPALLASLEQQSCQDFCVLARDDGSEDATLAILEDWAAAHPGRLRILRDDIRSGSAQGNFARLMQASQAPFVMFCDQDDVWKANKVALSLAAMRSAEERWGSTCPLLVHSDLQVVDEKLHVLGESFWAYQKLDPTLASHLNRVLLQNVVTGCAAMINRPLLETALPIPPAAIMHDWWLALVAAAFGQVVVIPEATIAYRQHASNDTGAKRWSWSYVCRKALQIWDRQELQSSLQRTRRQAEAFLHRYSSRLSPRQQHLVAVYASLDQGSWIGKRCTLLRHRLLKIGCLRNLGLLLRV